GLYSDIGAQWHTHHYAQAGNWLSRARFSGALDWSGTQYQTSLRYSPSGGAVGPPAERLRAASARAKSFFVHLPSPTSFSVPTILRTWWCRNERARAAIRTSSSRRVTSNTSRVFIGESAWQRLARKLEKSWCPTSSCAAVCIAPASSGAATSHARPRSMTSGARRLTIR